MSHWNVGIKSMRRKLRYHIIQTQITIQPITQATLYIKNNSFKRILSGIKSFNWKLPGFCIYYCLSIVITNFLRILWRSLRDQSRINSLPMLLFLISIRLNNICQAIYFMWSTNNSLVKFQLINWCNSSSQNNKADVDYTPYLIHTLLRVMNVLFAWQPGGYTRQFYGQLVYSKS